MRLNSVLAFEGYLTLPSVDSMYPNLRSVCLSLNEPQNCHYFLSTRAPFSFHKPSSALESSSSPATLFLLSCFSRCATNTAISLFFDLCASFIRSSPKALHPAFEPTSIDQEVYNVCVGQIKSRDTNSGIDQL